MKYLITLGCSWTWGAGLAYTNSMTLDDLKRVVFNKDLADSISFRGLLSEKYGYKNINFSMMKSSNQKQFRLARQFFSSDTFKKIKDSGEEIVVLWGTTTTGRNEVFSNEKNEYVSFLLNHPNHQSELERKLCNFFTENTYDHEHEIFELAQNMTHWNDYFKLLEVKNYWFDSFNHHDYTTNSTGTGDEYINKTCIENFAINHDSGRDLMSQLAIISGMDNYDSNYHSNAWLHDNTNRIDFLIEKGLINPHSFHPTVKGHALIASMMDHLFE